MRKSIIVLLIASICFSLTACSNKTTKNNSSTSTKSNEEDSNANSTASNQTNSLATNNTNNDNSKELNDDKVSINVETNTTKTKQYYIQKLDDIEKGLSDLDSLRAGNNSEMKQAAGEEYKRWDYALNEIYSSIKSQLSDSEMKALEEDELKWIKEKEIKASEAAKKFEGGTGEGLMYSCSLADSTKERCYYLVNTYFN